MSRIVWLASYPKSGNTWLRIFLANFLRDGSFPVDINDFRIGGISSDRRVADDALGVECSDLTRDELDRFRPALYRQIADESNEILYIKIHDAYTLNSDCEPIIPADATKAAIYLARNPLDVAVSFAHYSNKTIDESIDRMSNEAMTLAGRCNRLDVQLPQRLTSWSQHVRSWLDQQLIPVRLMRYEDMCRQPVEEFAETLRFMGLKVDIDRVRRAVSFSSFEALRQQELEYGFKGKTHGSMSFFRSGRAEAWREELTPEQADRLVRDHGEVMRRLGYLSQTGALAEFSREDQS